MNTSSINSVVSATLATNDLMIPSRTIDQSSAARNSQHPPAEVICHRCGSPLHHKDQYLIWVATETRDQRSKWFTSFKKIPRTCINWILETRLFRPSRYSHTTIVVFRTISNVFKILILNNFTWLVEVITKAIMKHYTPCTKSRSTIITSSSSAILWSIQDMVTLLAGSQRSSLLSPVPERKKIHLKLNAKCTILI